MADIAEPLTDSEKPDTPKPSWKKRLRSLLSGINLVIAAVAAVITISLSVWQLWPHQAYVFTSPSPSRVTQESCAFTAVGQGKPPAGQVIVVSNQVQGIGDNIDPYLHFGLATSMQNTDTWYVDEQIGVPKTAAGTPYTLTAWRLNANWVNNLIQNLPHHQTWWNAKEPPPGAKQVATANVTRNTNANCWKPGAQS